MKVLVIEDNDEIRNNLVTLIKTEYPWWHILETDNGQNGVNYALYLAPDLIICDIKMPGFDGHEVLRFLNSFERKIPFIFLTSLNDSHSKELGHSEGAAAYIVKPYSIRVLLEAIISVLTLADREDALIDDSHNNKKEKTLEPDEF